MIIMNKSSYVRLLLLMTLFFLPLHASPSPSSHILVSEQKPGQASGAQGMGKNQSTTRLDGVHMVTVNRRGGGHAGAHGRSHSGRSRPKQAVIPLYAAHSMNQHRHHGGATTNINCIGHAQLASIILLSFLLLCFI
ncbi:hypothetical protein LguiA_012482 [Lonicera macranthoides]